MRNVHIYFLFLGWFMFGSTIVFGNHRGHEDHNDLEVSHTDESGGYPISGVPFQVFVGKSHSSHSPEYHADSQPKEVVQTVIDAFHVMIEHREDYKRFDESLMKDVLKKVVIEPRVFNRDGKEFSFLVARMQTPGQVKLLINAERLINEGYLNHPEKLVPVLAREFQWVVSKAATKKKRQLGSVNRELAVAPIHTNKRIRMMSEKEREQALVKLMHNYLTTIDDYVSLTNQSFYPVGSADQAPPAQPDSTTKLYDIRVREALRHIVQDSYFQEHTPMAVRSLLNGKIWHVSIVNIEERDWATRTRVVPKDKAVVVGPQAIKIQPAKVLVNVHRRAIPEDPFYSITKDLPMGALSPEQLAIVIAWEIQDNIIEKSMRGHVAQDEKTAPK